MIWTVNIWAVRVKIEIPRWPSRDVVVFRLGDGEPFAEWDGERMHVLPRTAGELAEDLPVLLANALAGPIGWVRVADCAPSERMRVLLQKNGQEIEADYHADAIGGIWGWRQGHADIAVPAEPTDGWRLIRASRQEVFAA